MLFAWQEIVFSTIIPEHFWYSTLSPEIPFNSTLSPHKKRTDLGILLHKLRAEKKENNNFQHIQCNTIFLFSEIHLFLASFKLFYYIIFKYLKNWGSNKWVNLFKLTNTGGTVLTGQITQHIQCEVSLTLSTFKNWPKSALQRRSTGENHFFLKGFL